jgi:hypothetical protein
MTDFQSCKKNSECYLENTTDGDNQEPDQGVYDLSAQLANDPLLLRKKIDAVNMLGISAERRSIGIYSLVIDSRLIAPVDGGTESLGVKNSGNSGGGKSGPLSALLKLYPKNAYHSLTSATAKSFYAMGDTLKHKALILSEGLSLEARGNRDTEFAYCMRSLLSEGVLNYQRSEKIGGERTYVPVHVEGPISLVTTTVRGALESQLEDRILTIHPDESQEQTVRVLRQKADNAARRTEKLDEHTQRAWQHLHDSQAARDVEIPFAPAIVDFLETTGAFPLSARRAFVRVMSSIKTVTIVYQAQRKERDGLLVAEMADYAMAHQLIDGEFQESFNKRQECQDGRLALIQELGMMTPGKAAEKCGVSGAAFSQWMQPRIESGVLGWCDAHGVEFADTEALTKAKHKGAAFIYCTNGARLPSPYELTGDPRWKKGGDLYSLYDLRLDAIGPESYPEIAAPEERVPDLPCRSEEPAEHRVLH